MSAKNDVKDLLALLDDEKVIEKIISITSKKQKKPPTVKEDSVSLKEYNKLLADRDRLKAEKAELEKKYKKSAADYQKKFDELQKALDKLAGESDKFKEELEVMRQKCSESDERIKAYAESYDELERIYNVYCSLSDETKDSLSNVISSDSVLDFFISAGQWKNIEALWKNIAFRLDSAPEDELENMYSVFEWLFKKYNEFSGEYSLLDVKTGSTFDGDFHSKASKSAVSGKIKEILLVGYKNNTNGKITEKSIVRM